MMRSEHSVPTRGGKNGASARFADDAQVGRRAMPMKQDAHIQPMLDVHGRPAVFRASLQVDHQRKSDVDSRRLDLSVPIREARCFSISIGAKAKG